jgi:DNA-directed RNA polymerase beta subunit
MYTGLPDLLALQLESFRHFLDCGLPNQLEKGFKDLETSKGTICIDANNYKTCPPTITPEKALKEQRTYSINIYIPLFFVPFQLNEYIRHQHDSFVSYHLICTLPLLTDTSSFVVNGVRRVVVNQLVRCPNIYYKVKLSSRNKRSYSISFISDRGVWVRIERDTYKNILIRINDIQFDIFYFLRALGVTDCILAKSLKNPVFSNLDKNNRIIISSLIRDMVSTNGGTISNDIRSFLYEKFFTETGYSLSESGRMRMNKKFGLSSSALTLQPEDILAGLDAFLELEFGNLFVDDIDHLKNRRVRLLHHLLEEEIRRGLKRLREENAIYVKTKDGIRDNILPAEKKYLSDLEICSNPIQNIYLPRYISSVSYSKLLQSFPFGVGVLNSSYQKVYTSCKQQTEVFFFSKFGGNTNQRKKYHVSNHSTYLNCRIKEKQTVFPKSSIKSLVSPYIYLSLKSKYVTKTVIEYFSLSPLSQFMDQINPLAGLAQKRRLTCLGPGGVSRESGIDIRDIHPSHYGRICPIETPEGKNAGLVNSLASFASISMDGYVESNYLSFLNESLRVGKVVVPAEHQTQEVFYPLFFYKHPSNDVLSSNLVQDIKGNICDRKDSLFISMSPTAMISVATSLVPFLEHNDGNRALMASNMQRQAVPLLFPERPIVGTGFEGIIVRDSRSVHLSKALGKVVYVDSHSIKMKYKSNEGDFFETSLFDTFSRSNHNTLIYQYPAIRKDTEVLSGAILCDTSTSDRGEISLGRNLIVAYMPWEGYNFEDAVLLNQRVVAEQKFTSIHIEKFETKTEMVDGNQEEFYVPNGNSKSFDKYGILRPGVFVSHGEVLVGKVRPFQFNPNPYERLLYAIFDDVSKPTARDCSLRLTHGVRGRVFETFFFPKRKSRTKGFVLLHLLIKRSIQVGDKIAGRHGNKGIISNIIPESDMPYMQNGISIDVVLNPLGVPSRMNVGQIFECLLGFSGMFLEQNYRVQAFDEIYGKQASQALVSSQLIKLGSDLPFGTFSSTTFGKIPLFDGRTGMLFEHPISVGLAYILKLVHLVDDKIHARLRGPYTLITQQPVKGRSSQGGQRVGEMEVWALQGFSAPYILQEMLTLKSDDSIGRNKIPSSLCFKTAFPIASIPESFHVTLTELRALCFNLEYSTNHSELMKRHKKENKY